MIPLAAPDIQEAEIAAVTDVLRSSRLSLGPKLQQFEEELAVYAGARHAVAVNSGTSGLHLCIRALGLAEGDEAIVPSFTFIAAANVLRYERAVPVFADIDPLTLNLDPRAVEAAITSRTRCIIVAHTFGRPAELDHILEIARRHRLAVIEDACEAIGAEYRGRKVGPLGDAGVFAFYPNKQITTGEGGAVVTNDAAFAARIRSLRNQGRDSSKRDEWFQHTELGYSYRLPEINCALGLAQLRRIDEILKERTRIAAAYDLRLRSNPNLWRPSLEIEKGSISWFVYVVRLMPQFTAQHRDWIVEQMKARGIECGRYFAPIHLQPLYRTALPTQPLPQTEQVAERCIALPFFNQISSEQIDEVCRNLNELTESQSTAP